MIAGVWIGHIEMNEFKAQGGETRMDASKRVLLLVLAFALGGAVWGRAAAFEDEPEAHALYDSMVEAMRQADSLFFQSEYGMVIDGRDVGVCMYKAWLKKPNYARIEAIQNGKTKGVLVLDGEEMWIYWPPGRPQHSWEHEGEYAKEFRRSRFSSYMHKPAPLAMHSIGHEIGYLGTRISMTILDPSTFHGYTDSLQPYLDGVRAIGAEKVGDEVCHVIEASIMDGQRVWRLSVSKEDLLPRKLEETIRVKTDIVRREHWTGVTVDGHMFLDKFAWKPPEGWVQWRMPPIEEGLLKPGKTAPGFALASIDGETIRLSDYRGKVVWLYIWRAG